MLTFNSLGIALLFFLQAAGLLAQTQNINFRKVEIPGNRMWGISEMAMAGDKNTMAIGTGQGPLYLWDCEEEEIIKEIRVGGYYAGPLLEYNPVHDKYLKLTKTFFADWAPNKDRPTRVEVLNTETEEIIFRSEKVNDACWTPDGKYLVLLQGGKLYFFDVETGMGLADEEEIDLATINKSIQLDVVAYSAEVDPRNKVVAVSHLPSKSDIERIPRIRNDKKAKKAALKYNHLVSFYDLKSGKRIYSTDDLFDIIYQMEYSPDKNYLFVYSLPHNRSSQTASIGRQGYIQRVIGETGEVTRTIYPSQIENPDFKVDYDNQYMGVISLNAGKIPAPMLCNVHDYETARTLYSYSMDMRFLEQITLNKSSLVFLPDGETIIVAFGNVLGYWKYK